MRSRVLIIASAVAITLTAVGCSGTADPPTKLVETDSPTTRPTTVEKPTTTTTALPTTTTTTEPPVTTTAPPPPPPPTTVPPTIPPPTTPPPTAPPTTARPPAASSGASYANCTEARAAGVTPIHRGSPGYSSKLDRDGDGIACE